MAPWFLPPNPFSRGRADRLKSPRLALHLLSLGLLLLYVLPPWCDRRALWLIPGDGWRWLGLVLELVGSVFSIWGPYHLGRNFSGYVTLQEGHTLVTDGPYAIVRHPRYLGLISHLVGVSLVHRAGLALLLDVGAVALLVARAATEDRLLAEEFGDEWHTWAQRTKRLVPAVW